MTYSFHFDERSRYLEAVEDPLDGDDQMDDDVPLGSDDELLLSSAVSLPSAHELTTAEFSEWDDMDWTSALSTIAPQRVTRSNRWGKVWGTGRRGPRA